MNFEKKIFEQEGLKIDNERVLTYSQLSCPLECRYCFVEDINFNQKKDAAYLTEKQINLLEKLPEDVKTIMLGCDTEFFQNENDALFVLEKLASLKKDISVITKLCLDEDVLKKINEIDSKIKDQGNFITLSVSIPCFDNYKKWEPKVPSPEKRIKTLERAKNNLINTMVAMRPLIPDVNEEDLKKIVEETKDFCSGYYSCPLYLKDLDNNLIDKNDKSLIIEEVQPHWMPDKNLFYRIEKNGQMKVLENVIKNNNKLLFEGAAEGIKYLKEKYEKH